MRRKPSVLLVSILAHAVVLLVLGTAPWWSPIANWPVPHEALAFSEPQLARLDDIELPRAPRSRVTSSSASAVTTVPEPVSVLPSTGVAAETGRESGVGRFVAVAIEAPGAGGIEGVGAPTAPPPPPPAVRSHEPVRPGGSIRPPTKILNVAPQYPALARASHVEGVVILEAIIDARGNVESATVLRSIPLLDQAALDAVRQWTFSPTLLNGVAVPVALTVTVNFALSR